MLNSVDEKNLTTQQQKGKQNKNPTKNQKVKYGQKKIKKSLTKKDLNGSHFSNGH